MVRPAKSPALSGRLAFCTTIPRGLIGSVLDRQRRGSPYCPDRSPSVELMTTRPRPRTPELPRRVAVARVWATAGVCASVLLNVWSVAYAVNLDDLPAAPSATGISTPTGSTGSRGPSTEESVVQTGDGSFTVVALPAAATQATPSTGRVVRYTVEIEGGLRADTEMLATTVATVLTDARGWQTKDSVRFVNVSPAEAAKGAAVDVRVSLASPDTTDRLCAPLETRGEVSCHNGGRAVLNLRRWLLGAEAYGGDLAAYRTYLVNHEVGHALGHGHVSCPGAGKDAPVMMQQTYGLDGCTAWAWPTPRT